MLFVEAFLRSAAALTALLGAFLFVKSEQKLPSSKWIALVLASLAFGAVIHTAEGIAPPISVRAIMLPVSSGLIVFLWIAARSYFDDEFRAGRLEFAVIGAWFLLTSVDYLPLAANIPTADTLAGTIRQALSYALVGHVVFVVLNGAAPDLVEPRRRARIGFTLSILSIYLLNKIGENIFGYSALPIWFTALLYGLIFVLLARGLLTLITFDPSALETTIESAKAKPEAVSISPEQKRLIARLDHIMLAEQAYLDPGLSIGALAQRAGIAEHHLRVLINQAMGFRNFRTYLNGYRVKHALRLLTSVEQADLSILDVAMDSGFGSLASFNRIFKTATGQSPREMRSGLSGRQTGEEISDKTPHFQN